MPIVPPPGRLPPPFWGPRTCLQPSCSSPLTWRTFSSEHWILNAGLAWQFLNNSGLCLSLTALGCTLRGLDNIHLFFLCLSKNYTMFVSLLFWIWCFQILFAGVKTTEAQPQREDGYRHWVLSPNSLRQVFGYLLVHYQTLLLFAAKTTFCLPAEIGMEVRCFLFVIIITTMIMFVINIIIIEYQSGCLFASKSSDIGCAMRLFSPQASCAAVWTNRQTFRTKINGK